VLSPSGLNRFIADCWFSDEPLPAAYTHPAARALRETGGLSGRMPDPVAIDAYLRVVDVPGAIDQVRCSAREASPLRRQFLEATADAFAVMWDVGLEMLGRGPAVPFERSVRAATGESPAPSSPEASKELLARALDVAGRDNLLEAAEQWRGERLVQRDAIASLADIRISELDRLTLFNVVPHLPASYRPVPRANIRFLPIEDAWFSGSMNYLGRARRADGLPEYEATYEINASLEIAIPEFEQLISHEVVPGHVTTFAFLQHAYVTGTAGFEATVLTMNTRAATLFEGIANNALLIAHGITEISGLDDPDAQVGLLLARLQDEAKNQAAWLTWNEGWREEDVAAALRRDFLVTAERAVKLAGAWGRHPILGRMCLPAYLAGTEAVARLRREYPAEVVLPALYGCKGLVDVVTVEDVCRNSQI
ncbi:MAG: hypothetical protein ACM3NQ_24730, partial [Bacteroidales bacterium]